MLRRCARQAHRALYVGQAVLEKQQNSYLAGAAASSVQKDYSEQTAREINLAIRKLIEEAYERAKSLLTDHTSDLRRGAQLLLERETITPEEFPPLKQVPEQMHRAAE